MRPPSLRSPEETRVWPDSCANLKARAAGRAEPVTGSAAKLRLGASEAGGAAPPIPEQLALGSPAGPAALPGLGAALARAGAAPATSGRRAAAAAALQSRALRASTTRRWGRPPGSARGGPQWGLLQESHRGLQVLALGRALRMEIAVLSNGRTSARTRSSPSREKTRPLGTRSPGKGRLALPALRIPFDKGLTPSMYLHKCVCL